MDFRFEQDGNEAWIRYGDRDILSFQMYNVFFDRSFWVRDMATRPDGVHEVASMPTWATYGYTRDITRVDFKALEQGRRLVLEIVPTERQGGSETLHRILEKKTISVQLSPDGKTFIWDMKLEVEFLDDVAQDEFDRVGTFRAYKFPNPDGSSGLFIQFADPLPTYAVGPCVPMQEDWLGVREPYVGARNYRKDWQRRYFDIIVQTPHGKWLKTELNRQKLFHLERFNRRAFEMKRDGIFYIVRKDRSALKYEFDVESLFLHVCEWGNDFHFWSDFAREFKDGKIEKGRKLTFKYRVSDATSEEVRPLYDQAEKVQLTAEEYKAANQPAYEEPINTFKVSALEPVDVQAWAPDEPGRWEPNVGRQEGFGSVVLEHTKEASSCWQAKGIGSSQFCNPIAPNCRYRLCCYARVKDFVGYLHEAGPQLGVIFHHYNGPASAGAEKVDVQTAFSPARQAIKDEWTYVELVTAPAPAYALNATLILKFEGMGTAYFTEVKFERLPE